MTMRVILVVDVADDVLHLRGESKGRLFHYPELVARMTASPDDVSVITLDQSQLDAEARLWDEMTALHMIRRDNRKTLT